MKLFSETHKRLTARDDARAMRTWQIDDTASGGVGRYMAKHRRDAQHHEHEIDDAVGHT